MKKGFTVIELLVVVAVIGLLSSVVLVQTRDVRDRARIKRGLQFGREVQGIVGMETIGEWKLENNLKDSSNDNNGVYVPAGTPSYINGADVETGKALELDGSAYVRIPDSSDLGPRPDMSVTIDMFLKPSSFSGYPIILLREPHYYLYLNSGRLHFDIETYTCYCQLEAPNSLPLGKWSHISVSYIPKSGDRNPADDTMKMFIDGVEVASKNTCPCAGTYLSDYTEPLYIGGCPSCSNNFIGAVDNVRVYNENIELIKIREEDMYHE